MISVIGGVYREICSFPRWNQIYGSAGRAAAAIASTGNPTKLITMLAPAELDIVKPIFDSLNVATHANNRQDAITFKYLNPLSSPEIFSHHEDRKITSSIEYNGDDVVAFGLLEANLRITAKRCVYDPQSPNNPKLFKDTGSNADRLAVIMNKGEASILFGNLEPCTLATLLREADNADIAIIKAGLLGSYVFDGSEVIHIPAYDAENFFSIGSGDMFVAAFSHAWINLGRSPAEAAEYASRSAAYYVENKLTQLLDPDHQQLIGRQTVEPSCASIYLAAPFRELGQRWLVDETRRHLKDFGLNVFSPVHDIGHGSAEEVVQKDLRAIRDSERVFALLNGSSPGTVFEVGYASALNKPVYCIATNMRRQDIKLPEGSGCHIYEDYSSAVFHASIK